jgi:2-succinyl-5-enolpyruvyl-6-hydroxy-3-cyclohexene-1-carboxylate synthase
MYSSMLLPLTKSISDYFKKLDAVNELRELKSKIYLDKIPFSDFKFFEKVIKLTKLTVANQ